MTLCNVEIDIKSSFFAFETIHGVVSDLLRVSRRLLEARIGLTYLILYFAIDILNLIQSETWVTLCFFQVQDKRIPGCADPNRF